MSREVHAGCGYAQSDLLVICTDAAGEMDDESQLALLARVSVNATIRVGSIEASRAVGQVLASAGEQFARHPIQIVYFDGCAGDCRNRIEVVGGV